MPLVQETIHFQDPRHLSRLYASDEANLHYLEQVFSVSMVTRDDWVQISGEERAIADVKAIFFLLDSARNQGLKLRTADFNYVVESYKAGAHDELLKLFTDPLVIRLKRQSIVPKTINQKRYLLSIKDYPVTFGIGPAGTGKTFLAVAAALQALAEGHVERIVLTRPAVEAGEALGFLPGDLQEKILPYLTPLYDAMYLMIGKDQAAMLLERNALEIAPLAYMRGRTLANAFVILDEAQNATSEQMMMFLTRMGEGSRMVVTGDITQIDLPRNKPSGLVQAARVLHGVEGIEIFRFVDSDVVRHPIVRRIIAAYAAEAEKPLRQNPPK
jgi:phosphate starvation-inducible PhoH-like protein